MTLSMMTLLVNSGMLHSYDGRLRCVQIATG